jgi:enediyne biosynthesis protein E4
MLPPLPSCLCRLVSLLGASLSLVLALPAAPASSRPLAPPSSSSGDTLFTTLSAEELGLRIDNDFADPRMWGVRYREFSLGAIGTGLTAGDFDGDGRVDLYVVSKTESSRLFRNLGNWQFEDVTETAGVSFPAGDWTQGATFVDVNNDGWLDLYVCRFNAPNLLFINQGDGTFREEAVARGLAVVDASSMAFFADYDRDGWLDVYLQTNLLEVESAPTGQPDYLFRNRGDGTFENVTERAGISGPTQGHSATWWDFDGDGWPDLYVANDFRDPDTLYRNNRDGTFTNVLSWVVPHTPHSSMGADLGDLNNDGHLDLLVADMATTTRKKDHRGMAKVRAGLPEPTPPNPNAAPQYMHNALFLGTGAGRVLEAAFLAGLEATDWTWAVLLEDLDNDGRLDVYITNGMVRELHGADIVGRMMTQESQRERIRIMRSTPRLDERNLAYRNEGDLRFTDVSEAWGLDHVGVSFGAVLADFDGDGDLDLVFSNYEGTITACRNDSTTGNRLLLDLRGTRSNRFGLGARVEMESASGRQVRELVLGRGYLSASEPVAHFGLGEDPAAERITIRWPSGHVQVVENLAAGHRYTITEPDHPPEPAAAPTRPPPWFVDITPSLEWPQPAIDTAYDEFRRQPLLPIRRNVVGPAVAIADLDGDGLEDLLFGGNSSSRGQILANRGHGHYLPYGASVFGEPGRAPDAQPLAFDANGNGRLDLLLTKGGVMRPPGDAVYTPRLFFNQGEGQFADAPAGAWPSITPSAGPVAAADFNRDGRLDVVVGARGVPGAYPAPGDSFLLVNEGGRFRDATDELAPALRRTGVVNAVLWTDVDGDGWLDLLIAREWGPILFLRNEEGRRFTDASEAFGFAGAGSGFWHSLAAADFNGDGRLDYAVGNLGLNTRYRATPERPALLFRGPFGGREQIIEAAYSAEDDQLYPVAAREQLLPVIPTLARKFPTAESYAVASLNEVVGADWLDQAERYAITELRSGVFLSQPDGTYRFSPWPRLAQIAPIFGLVTGDFDGDGHTDIAYVGNSYAPTAWTGRFDGGLGGLLRGDGRGGFTFVPALESGIVVPYDGQALALTDFDADGWPDFVITRYNERRLALRHTGDRDSARSFSVRLQGPPGNPTAIGARITVELSDGTRQTGEVAAGSGYLSQSTPALFFGYPASNPPRQLVVRWPHGPSTEHPWPDTAQVLLPAPQP